MVNESVPETEWHFMRSGTAEGPISFSELQSRAQSGSLDRADLVWQDGLPDWIQAGKVKGLFRIPPPPPKPCSKDTLSLDGAISGKVDPIGNRKMIAQLQQDAADSELLIGEIMRVAVRLNPVNIQIYNFLGIIDAITENTPRPEIAKLVQQAMQQVDLTNAAQMLDDALDGVTSVGPEMIKDYTSNLTTVWPESIQLVRHRWLDDPNKEGALIQQQLQRAVLAHRSDLEVIQKQFRQLQEYHPRYHAILTRKSAWEYVFGFAAGFFGGALGMVGAQVWDDWRGKSDGDFVQSFANAVNQFSQSGLAFTQKMEQDVEFVVEAFLKDQRDFMQGTISALESVVNIKDISDIYHKSREPGKPNDENLKQFFEIVLTNLREKKISPRSESNMRELLGLH